MNLNNTHEKDNGWSPFLSLEFEQHPGPGRRNVPENRIIDEVDQGCVGIMVRTLEKILDLDLDEGFTSLSKNAPGFSGLF